MTAPRGRGIALGGFMGTGKSEVARRLAEATGLPLVDTDAVLTERYGPIERQIRVEGEPVFRERERALIASLCDGIPRVLATGGGAWCHAESRRALDACYDTVVLTAPFEVLAGRVGEGSGRPLWERAAELFRARQAAYGDAALHVDVSRGDPDDVARSVLSGLADPDRGRQIVPVDLGDRAYDVVIGPGAFRGLGERLVEGFGRRRVVVVTDSVVGPLWLPALEEELRRAEIPFERVAIPAGEPQKTLATWARCVDALLELGVDRSTPILAMGGGVLGDVAGFAAAVTLRGLPVVQIPTTLLAMVDSSVGGKTAVDHPRGKNLVGVFHQPSLVWAGAQTLATLDPAELRAGLGEVVKTALIGDPDLLELLEAEAPAVRQGAPDLIRQIVARCVAVKADVVAQDEREGGWRAVLNAGHTLGHALEAALDFQGLRHGEAVMIGLIEETAWGAARGHCAPDLPERLRDLARRLGLPTQVPPVDPARVRRALRVDKKGRGDMLVLPLPRMPGAMSLVNLPIAQLDDLVPERS